MLQHTARPAPPRRFLDGWVAHRCCAHVTHDRVVRRSAAPSLIWLQVLSAHIELGSGADVQSQIAALNKLRRTVVRKRDPHAMEARVHNPMDREKGIAYAAVRNETIGLYRTLRVLPSTPPPYPHPHPLAHPHPHAHARTHTPQSSARLPGDNVRLCGRATAWEWRPCAHALSGSSARLVGAATKPPSDADRPEEQVWSACCTVHHSCLPQGLRGSVLCSQPTLCARPSAATVPTAQHVPVACSVLSTHSTHRPSVPFLLRLVARLCVRAAVYPVVPHAVGHVRHLRRHRDATARADGSAQSLALPRVGAHATAPPPRAAHVVPRARRR